MKNILFVLLLFTGTIISQERINVLHYLIKSDSSLNFLIRDIRKYEPQILYTQIDRDKDNKILLRTIPFNANEVEYFYPASTVKLPAALLALEKINELNIHGLTKSSRMETDSAYSGQTTVISDSTSENGYPSIAHYIKKIFLVSDNEAFNRLYEFLGQEYLNETLHKKGYLSAKITNRLSIPLSLDENRCTNPVRFYDENGKIIYEQPLVCNEKTYPNTLNTTLKGIGFIRNDSLINEPKDFSNSNSISVYDLQKILISVIYPEAVKPEERFNLTADDYKFLYKYMSMFPRESSFPSYDTSYYDSYVKYLLLGDSREGLPEYIRIFDKVGLAYGYLIDNAYIADFKNNIEFFLTAVIYVNEDGIFNDDKYEYDTVGFPFMKNLGRAVYNYELIRERNFKPDLSKFRINYGD